MNHDHCQKRLEKNDSYYLCPNKVLSFIYLNHRTSQECLAWNNFVLGDFLRILLGSIRVRTKLALVLEKVFNQTSNLWLVGSMVRL